MIYYVLFIKGKYIFMEYSYNKFIKKKETKYGGIENKLIRGNEF